MSGTRSRKSLVRVHMASYGMTPAFDLYNSISYLVFSAYVHASTHVYVDSAATNNQTGEGVAIKKVTNVFSKKILAKRALREIKLLQHFRGHRNVRPNWNIVYVAMLTSHRLPACMIWTFLAQRVSMRHISTKVLRSQEILPPLPDF